MKQEKNRIFTATERIGRPRATISRDDYIVCGIAVRSLRGSSNKIKSSLFASGRNVSLMTLSRGLNNEFGLSSRSRLKYCEKYRVDL